MLEQADKPEAAHAAFELLRPDLDQEAVDRRAYNWLSKGQLTGDMALSLWVEKYRLHLLEAKLRQLIDG